MIKKYYFTISNLFLVTAGIYFSVSGFYSIVASKLEQIPVARNITTRAVIPDAQVARPFSYYKIITERNLFDTKGQPEQKIDEKEIDPTKLEKTDLKLTLWGTVAGGGEGTRYAIIEDQKERKQYLYEEGMTVASATVKKILRKQVILSIDGKDQKLEMKKLESGKKPRYGGSGRAGVRPNIAGSSSKIQLKRSTIDDAMGNLGELMKQVAIRPHFKDGKPDGIMLSNVKSKSIFRKMGLRNGDIIMGIDGEDIKTVDDAMKFYENLKSSSNVALQIKRRGKSKNIEFNIQ
jgi:general secretion pathway protein C